MGVGGGSSASASRCRSTGATMSVTPASSTCCYCCINIYVNNNVQGVTNSVLFGSSVAMRDPGVRVVPSRRPPRAASVCRGKQRRQQQKREKKKKKMGTAMWAAAAAIVCLATIVLVLSVKRM